MEHAGWRPDRPLKSLVLGHHGRFEAHQLVRLLQWRPSDAGRRGGARLRFRADLSGAFAGTEITRLSVGTAHPAAAGETVELRTQNYSIASVTGPLPEPFFDWVREQERAREHAMAGFLDVFNQRLNMLRFEFKASRTIGLNNRPPEQTEHAAFLAAIMGLGQAGMADRVPLPRRALLAMAGLLSNARRSAPVVAQVLTLFLDAKVTLAELVGAWQPIEEGDRIALGRANHALGRSAVLGRRVWDQQARVRLDVSTGSYEQFCRLLPRSLAERSGMPDAHVHYDQFAALLRLLLDRLCDCEVRLSVPAAAVPAPLLRASGAPAGRRRGLRLGQTAWLAGSRDGDGGRGGKRAASFVVRAYDPLPEAA